MAEKKGAKKCKECKKEFDPHRHWQIFCSSSCRIHNWKKSHPYISTEDLAEIKRKLNIK